MKKFIVGLILLGLLAGCSSPGQATPIIHTDPVYATALPATQTPENAITQAFTETNPVQKALPSATPRSTLAPDEWKMMPIIPEISDNARNIYLRGLEMGNDPTHFSKVGDCQNVDSFFLSSYDDGTYRLGSDFEYLTPTIDYYQGSWSRKSLAVKGGFNVAAVLSPLRSDPKNCEVNESPLACELRVWKPSVVIVSMETWWGKKPTEEYEKYMRQVLDYIISQGAVPVLATKADNLEGGNAIDQVVARLANEYDIPLWNYWVAVQPLPNHGLLDDNFHLTFDENLFDNPEVMKSAWPWRNLTALQTLDSFRRAVYGE